MSFTALSLFFLLEDGPQIRAWLPYLGAWSAGAFTVLTALGQGTSTALIMGVIVLLANGALQQLIQPIA